jgi:hypothetical protein
MVTASGLFLGAVGSLALVGHYTNRPMPGFAFRFLGTVGVAWTLGDYLRTSRHLALRTLFSHVLALSNGVQRPEMMLLARSQFLNLVIPALKPRIGKPHASAAAARASAAAAIEHFAAGAGFTTYNIGMANRDIDAGSLGTRQYFWAKDVTVPVRDDPLPTNPLRVFIDVDYYVDMDVLLAEEPMPTILYTIEPMAVAEPGYDGTAFTFNQSDEIVMHVANGAPYKHRLWNYGTDHIMAIKFGSTGWPVRAATYLVERKAVTRHKSLVLLLPTGTWGSWTAWLTLFLDFSFLRRLSVVQGAHTRLRVMHSDEMYVSTGAPGSYCCATIPARCDDAIAATARTSSVKVSAAVAKSFLEAKGHEASIMAASLAEYHRATATRAPDVVFEPQEAVRSYQFVTAGYDADARPSLTSFMSPVIPECFAPLQSEANEFVAVKRRVLDVASHVEVTPFLLEAMREFASLVVPDHLVHSGHPASHEEVHVRQSRPSQQRLLAEGAALGWNVIDIVKSFLKKEAAQSPADPRVISTVAPQTKLEYSRYTYSIADLLKDYEWYAFGRTPLEIATRVAKIASCCDALDMTDCSRFDGRVSSAMRALERIVALRFMAVEEHENLCKLMDKQIGQRCVTTSSVKYESGLSRLSGSPETSVFNTLDNAFMAYLSFRMTRLGGVYMDKAAAWAALGIYGGDDGFSPSVDPTKLLKAAGLLGQVLKIDTIKRGDVGVTFLSRIYGPQVWFGDLNSMCSLKRTLSKFHSTPHMPGNVTRLQKLVEKAAAYWLTDRNTPIIGPLVTRIVAMTGVDPVACRELGLAHWSSLVAAEMQYPNEPADWMDDVVRTTMPFFDVDKFSEVVSSVSAIHGFLELPRFVDPTPPAPHPTCAVVVDDDIIAPASCSDTGSEGRLEPADAGDMFAFAYDEEKFVLEPAGVTLADIRARVKPRTRAARSGVRG